VLYPSDLVEAAVERELDVEPDEDSKPNRAADGISEILERKDWERSVKTQLDRLLRGSFIVSLWSVWETGVIASVDALKTRAGVTTELRDVRAPNVLRRFERFLSEHFDIDLAASVEERTTLQQMMVARHVLAHVHGLVARASKRHMNQLIQWDGGDTGIRVFRDRLFIDLSFAERAWNVSDTTMRRLIGRVRTGAIEPLPVETREKPDITVEKAREVAMALGKNGAMWWAMCITGMNPKEYWGPWRVESDRIRIFGTKRAGRRRSIPLLWVPVKPHITREGFKTALQKTKLRYTPKNGRDAFAQWMEEVGLPESRRKAYMGHGKRTMTDIYTRKDVSGRLEEDAETLRDYIGENYQQLQVMK
jgi:hypothetical protein